MIVADMSWQLVFSVPVPCLLAEGSCNSLQQPALKMLKFTWGEVARMMWGKSKSFANGKSIRSFDGLGYEKGPFISKL